MKMNLKRIGIVLLGVLLGIILTTLYNQSRHNKVVEVPLIVPDTIYRETDKRDSIKHLIDSITNSLSNTNNNEEEFNKAISDTDSLAILDKFYELVTKPIR